MLRRLLLFIFVLINFINTAPANELSGTICLGVNLAKPFSDQTDRLYLKIDDSPNIYFLRTFNGPRAIVENLDIQKNHMVKVYFDNQIVNSWKLNFSKLKTNGILIWRSPGSWRMEPIASSSCK